MDGSAVTHAAEDPGLNEEGARLLSRYHRLS